MLILSIRTDKPNAEIGLFNDAQQLSYETWQAHRQLAESLHQKIEQLLKGLGKTWQDIEGVVAYQGPGSFTGLRIGLTVANTLAQSLKVPIVGGLGEGWLVGGAKELLNGKNQEVVLPEYGAPVHITLQKK